MVCFLFQVNLNFDFVLMRGHAKKTLFSLIILSDALSCIREIKRKMTEEKQGFNVK